MFSSLNLLLSYLPIFLAFLMFLSLFYVILLTCIHLIMPFLLIINFVPVFLPFFSMVLLFSLNFFSLPIFLPYMIKMFLAITFLSYSVCYEFIFLSSNLQMFISLSLYSFFLPSFNLFFYLQPTDIPFSLYFFHYFSICNTLCSFIFLSSNLQMFLSLKLLTFFLPLFSFHFLCSNLQMFLSLNLLPFFLPSFSLLSSCNLIINSQLAQAAAAAGVMYTVSLG